MLDKDLPLVRLFWLEIKPEYLKVFQDLGATNLSQSIQTEAGTLTMYSAHREDSPTACLVFEIYKNEGAYQTHINSAHFQAFAQLTPLAIHRREMVKLRPYIVQEKLTPLYQVTPNQQYLLLTKIKIKPQAIKVVKDHWISQLHHLAPQTSHYLAADSEDPTSWYFLEVCTESQPSFSHDLLDLEELAVAHATQVFSADILVSQGGLQLLYRDI
ncbi:putative quinol monooxygenase [Streptococcus cuniculipharyngis]|uniref:ABM domain-containing protein n=1 Tax=Streptococcus cuniculipharyngis TaxID=1562651 RepID=A0A5C5SDI7_9STRE|nr:antibiotic biosynthesis monooxygenase [Streptococcus cuniculipharyngis]TWS98834.1 hypothetical protein FRX57_01065 [Streptococcus cuniculipharyngis]